jgi:hypothetical protein
VAAIPGTNVIAPIVPTDTADVHPTHFDTYGVGGYRTVATIAERDAIPAPRRSAGMLVFVLADGGSTWRLGANLTTWSAVTGDGGSGGGAPASLEIGTVTTGAAGSQAAATITGDPPDQVLNLTIPRGDTGAKGDTGNTGSKGDQGDPGAAGPPNTLTIGTVTTGAAGSSASASITGTAPSQTLNLTIPRGNAGDAGAAGQAGAAATIAIGTVTTGAAGSTASVTNSGTSSAAILDITIPRGDAGATGAAGTTSWNGITDKPATFAPSAHESSHRTGGADEIAAVYQTVSQLTADANNLQLPAADTVFISSDAARTISGFVCTREQKVINNGAHNITISHDSASSSSANRVLTEWSGSYILSPGGLVYLIPDPTANKIRAY